MKQLHVGADKKQILRTMESCALSSALTGGWTGTGMVQVEADGTFLTITVLCSWPLLFLPKTKMA